MPDRYKEALDRLQDFIAGLTKCRCDVATPTINGAECHARREVAHDILAELRRLKGEAER